MNVLWLYCLTFLVAFILGAAMMYLARAMK